MIRPTRALPVLTLFILFAAMSPGEGKAQGWQQIATFPVRNGFLLPHFINELYGFVGVGTNSFAGATDVSLYRTTDGGISWVTTSFPHFKNSPGISDIFFVDSLVGYVGCYTDGFWKTTDAGETWRKIAAIAPWSFYILDDVIFANRQRSNDDAATWQDVAASGTASYTAVGGNRADRVIFSNYNAQMLYSSDRGATFRATPATYLESFTLGATPGSDVFFRSVETGDPNNVQRSTDGGATWSVLQNGPNKKHLTGGTGISGCAVYVQGANDGEAEQGVWRSRDLGETWEAIGGPDHEIDSRISLVGGGEIVFVGGTGGELWKYSPRASPGRITTILPEVSIDRIAPATIRDPFLLSLCKVDTFMLSIEKRGCSKIRILAGSVRLAGASLLDFTKQPIGPGANGTVKIEIAAKDKNATSLPITLTILRDDLLYEDTTFEIPLKIAPMEAITFEIEAPEAIRVGELAAITISARARTPLLLEKTDIHFTLVVNTDLFDPVGVEPQNGTTESHSIQKGQIDVKLNASLLVGSDTTRLLTIYGTPKVTDTTATSAVLSNISVGNGPDCTEVLSSDSRLLTLMPACGDELMMSYMSKRPISAALTVRPNPARGVVSVRVQNSRGEGYYRIIDVMGRQVTKGALPPGGTIDCSSLAAGVYWIEVVSDGVTASGQVVMER